MPWSTSDVDRHMHGLTPHEKSIWVAAGNAALHAGKDDGAAIRIANAAVNRHRASGESRCAEGTCSYEDHLNMNEPLQAQESRWAIFDSVAEAKGCVEGDVIKGAKLCGFVSESHRRRYPPEALQAAVRSKAYEGKPSYANHKSNEPGSRPERKIEDSLGAVENVRFDAKRGLVGDLRLNPHHPMTPRLKWAAENLPQQFMMSHMADLYGARESDGFFKTLEIEAVHSVDVVSAGGTTSSIFESAAAEDHTMELRTMSVAEIAAQRPDLFVTTVNESRAQADELQKLKDRVTAVEAENKTLKGENDTLKATKALGERNAAREKKIGEAKLPKELDTPTFRELALESSTTDEAFAKMLTERTELAKGVKSPTSSRRSVGESLGAGQPKEYTPKSFAAHLKSDGQLN